MSTDPKAGGTPTARTPERKRRGEVDRRFEAKTVAALAVGALVIIFAVVNSQNVKVDFLVTTTRVPFVIALVAALLIGFLFGNLMRRRAHPRRKG
jgi:uncharacterized integral membrane protein